MAQLKLIKSLGLKMEAENDLLVVKMKHNSLHEENCSWRKQVNVIYPISRNPLYFTSIFHVFNVIRVSIFEEVL